MSKLYTLDEYGNPKPCTDLIEWSEWFAKDENRILEQTEIDGLFVSTVFLGMNHSFGSGEELLWETYVFKKGNSEVQERYSTRKAALEGHKKWADLFSEKSGVLAW